jgi:hypothetical protein
VGFKEPQPENTTVCMGGMCIALPTKNIGKGKAALFKFYGFRPVTLYLKDGIIQCDASFFSGVDGVSPVEIKDNDFVVRPLGWDRNYTENAVEVVNQNGLPIFQIIKKRAGVFELNGIFVAPDGRRVMGSRAGISDYAYDLPPLFKYPSYKFLGKFADGSN